LDQDFEEMVGRRLHFVGMYYPLLGYGIVQSPVAFIIISGLRCHQTPANSSPADLMYPSFDPARAQTQSSRFCMASSSSYPFSWSQEIVLSHPVIVIASLCLHHGYQSL
jgi:hypothetical protein